MPARKANRVADDSVVDAMVVELRRISKILAFSCVRTTKREEQIAFLNSVGYTPAEVGEILGIAPNAVSVALYQAKNKGRHRRSRRVPK